MFNKVRFNAFYVFMKRVPIVTNFKRPIYQTHPTNTPKTQLIHLVNTCYSNYVIKICPRELLRFI